jgi:mannose-6-phosphate isomerase-like protein (cupin superfamily)
VTPVCRENAEHYVWGDACDGWHLLKDPQLSVIHERMPAGATETRHRHHFAQQFFFILSGTATLEINEVAHALHAGQGMHVPAGTVHQFSNRSTEALEFLVVSQPPNQGDREVMSDSHGGGQKNVTAG